MGDIVLSIGDMEISSKAQFFRAIRKYKNGSDLVDARVYVLSGNDPKHHALMSRNLDPGDFRLMYGVSSLRRLD